MPPQIRANADSLTNASVDSYERTVLVTVLVMLKLTCRVPK